MNDTQDPPPAGNPNPAPQPDNTPPASPHSQDESAGQTPPASEPAPEPAAERQVFDEPEVATPEPEPVAPVAEQTEPVAAEPTHTPAPTSVAEPAPTPEPTIVEPTPEAVIQGAPERSGDKPESIAEPAQPSGQPIFGGQIDSALAPEAQPAPPVTPIASQLPAHGTRPDGTPLSGEEKLFGAIGYIDILALVPLLARRDSEYCQHHGRQGLIIAVIFIFLWILAALSSTLAWIIVPLRVITIVAGFYLAYQGDWFKIPGIYDVSLKLKLDKSKPPAPPTDSQ